MGKKKYIAPTVIDKKLLSVNEAVARCEYTATFSHYQYYPERHEGGGIYHDEEELKDAIARHFGVSSYEDITPELLADRNDWTSFFYCPAYEITGTTGKNNTYSFTYEDWVPDNRFTDDDYYITNPGDPTQTAQAAAVQDVHSVDAMRFRGMELPGAGGSSSYRRFIS